jgi:hypothetical protein
MSSERKRGSGAVEGAPSRWGEQLAEKAGLGPAEEFQGFLL